MGGWIRGALDLQIWGAPFLPPICRKTLVLKGFGDIWMQKWGAPNLQIQRPTDPTPHLKPSERIREKLEKDHLAEPWNVGPFRKNPTVLVSDRYGGYVSWTRLIGDRLSQYRAFSPLLDELLYIGTFPQLTIMGHSHLKRAEYGFGEYGFNFQTPSSVSFRGSLSSGNRTQ